MNYTFYNTEIEQHLINKYSEGVELSGDGKWFHKGEAVTDRDMLEFIFENLEFNNDRLEIKTRKENIPVNVNSSEALIINLQFKGAGGFEKIILTATSGITNLDINSLKMDYDKMELYCNMNDSKARFLKRPMIQILDRLMEGAEGKYFLKLCGQVISI